MRPEFPVQGASISRNVVLLVDTLNCSFESLASIRKALRRFVDDQMTDRDLVALKTTTGMLGVLEQFTQDKKILRIGIGKILPWRITNTDSLFTPHLAGRIMRDDQTAIQLGMQILKVEEGTDIPDGTIPKALDDIPITESSIQSLMDMASIMTKAKARVVLSEARYQRLLLTGTAAAVVDRLAEMPGQRMIAMFSDGFSSVEPSGQTDVADLQPVISRAAQSGVSFYTYNARGLVIPMLTASMAGASIAGATRIDRRTDDLMSSLSQSQHDLENALGVLAAETGGEYFTNTNDLSGRMQGRGSELPRGGRAEIHRYRSGNGHF